MKPANWIITALFFIIFMPLANAQSTSADFMRSMGKMYVVVAVILAVFVGIVFFLVYLDRRLTKIENQIKDHG